jgi:hypothetical protein
MVTDAVSNVSNTLTLTPFTIDTTAPTLSEITAIPTPTNDTTPNYTFTTNEAGTITYTGSCSNTITLTLTTLIDATYSNCTLMVTDATGNVSTALVITAFTVAVTSPAPVPTPIVSGGGGGSSSSSSQSSLIPTISITTPLILDAAPEVAPISETPHNTTIEKETPDDTLPDIQPLMPPAPDICM